jgi:hypothetical protein
MKAEELMVGDWVMWKNRQVQIARVSGIVYSFGQIDVVLAHCNDDNLLETHDIKSVSPIPLTPEILEKNGFTNRSVITVGTPKMRWESEDTRTEITIWMDDTLPMEIVKNVYYEDEVSYTLPFPGTVSQLQHALRLCGIEKEIEL